MVSPLKDTGSHVLMVWGGAEPVYYVCVCSATPDPLPLEGL